MKFETVDSIVRPTLLGGMVLSAFMIVASTVSEVACNNFPESDFQSASCKFPGVIMR